MARAAIIYKDTDAAFAAKAYEAAVKAWKYIADNNDTTGFKNPEGIVTGEYPDANTLDERFWAASELYLAADAEAAGAKKSDAENYASFIRSTISDVNLKLGLGWTDMAMYAVYDLAKSSTEFASGAKAILLAEADKLISAAAPDRYYQSLGTNYYWGSNMGIASNGELLYMAARVADEKAAPKYKTAASKELDYLLGANAMGYSFVTGYGIFCPKNVHHRPSIAAGGKAMPGMLVGGADNALEDDYAKKICKNEAPSMCYVDSDASYSTNEVTVYWNSPLIYILAAEGN
jgi:endoglucanase